MKLKALLLALMLAAGVASAAAVAKGPPPGKGKNKTSSASTSTSTSENHSGKGKKRSACKQSIILKGTFGSGASDSFTIHVKKANAHGRKYADKDLTLMVDDKTKFRRRGPAELDDFEEGDWLNVQARRVCENAAGPSSSTEEEKLLARRVVGKPAEEGAGGETETTPDS